MKKRIDYRKFNEIYKNDLVASIMLVFGVGLSLVHGKNIFCLIIGITLIITSIILVKHSNNS